MVAAALIVQALFSVLGLIPTGARPSHSDIFSGVHADYKLVLNVIGLVLFVALFALTARRGVDRSGLRDDGRPREGAALRSRGPHPLLLLSRAAGRSSSPIPSAT